MTPTTLADLRHTDPKTAFALASLRNLEAVLKWAPSLAGIESVQHDEYNYDIALPLGDGRWAVFGVS